MAKAKKNVQEVFNKDEVKRLINESIKEQLSKEKERFEKIVEGVEKSKIENWLLLDDFEFYKNIVKRMKGIKVLYKGNSELNEMVDHILEYTEKTPKELLSHLDTKEGREEFEEAKEMLGISTMKLVALKVIGIIAFTAEGIVLTASFAGRVVLKAGSELYKAGVNTFKYAVADSKNYSRAMKNSYDKNIKSSSLKETLNRR